MADTTFDATSLQSPQVTPTVGAGYDETTGGTIPAHISSTMPTSASIVVAAAQSNASFGAQLHESLWAFDPLNHKLSIWHASILYGMPSY
uniref:Uncharacterized protein n=1 Tax=Medicago truncatula TaxID=3880 RepID=Q2HSM5_MEDTR|nr:hypothetical protein MtrDRAFT_AC151521g51v2 [Medicago truncatula]